MRLTTDVRAWIVGLARGGADALTDVVMSAGSNAQKIAAIRRAAERMPATDLAGWLRSAEREGIISAEVARASRQPDLPGR